MDRKDNSEEIEYIFLDLLDFGFKEESVYKSDRVFGTNLCLTKKIAGSFDYISIPPLLQGSTNIKSLKEEMVKTFEHLSYIKSKLEALEYKFAFDFEISCDDDYTIWLYCRISK